MNNIKSFIKKEKDSQVKWLKPIILATQKAGIRRIVV
jgi:hypothetical protein